MTKIKAALFTILFSGLAIAQSLPQGINYQAVALDQSGQPIPGVATVDQTGLVTGVSIGSPSLATRKTEIQPRPPLRSSIRAMQAL